MTRLDADGLREFAAFLDDHPEIPSPLVEIHGGDVSVWRDVDSRDRWTWPYPGCKDKVGVWRTFSGISVCLVVPAGPRHVAPAVGPEDPFDENEPGLHIDAAPECPPGCALCLEDRDRMESDAAAARDEEASYSEAAGF